MQIRPTNNVHTTHSINLQPRNTTQSTSGSVPVDTLDISTEAQLLSTQSTGTSRTDRIADIKTQIASGQYETPAKLEAAVSRMFEEYA